MRKDEELFQKANDIAMGRGVPQDYHKAAKLCRKAADLGNMQAKFVILASSYEPFLPGYHNVDCDEVVPFRYLNYRHMFSDVSHEEAMKTLRECAESGIRAAQYLMYENVEDQEEKNVWLKKAADNGVLPAMKTMQGNAEADGKDREVTDWKARVFTTEDEKDRMKFSLDGSVTPEYADWLINAPDDIDREENRKYYRIAAEAGYAEAQVKMGRTYDSNSPEFLYWMEKAGEQDNCNACENLMDLYAADNQPKEKYVYWTKRGADQGDGLMQVYLAEYFDVKEFLPGVRNPYYNPKAAMEYYLKSVDYNREEAICLRDKYRKERKNNE